MTSGGAGAGTVAAGFGAVGSAAATSWRGDDGTEADRRCNSAFAASPSAPGPGMTRAAAAAVDAPSFVARVPRSFSKLCKAAIAASSA